MWHSRRFISRLLILVLLTGLFGTAGLNTQNNSYAGQITDNYYNTKENTEEISSFSKTPTKPTPPIKWEPTAKPTPTTKPTKVTKPVPTTRPAKPTPTPTVKPKRPTTTPRLDIDANLRKYNKVYPYANIEEPAKLEGLEIEFQENVEFLPEDASYNIEDAPLASFTSESDLEEFDTSTGIPNFQTDLLNKGKTYQPGTNLLKFRDSSVTPQKGKIYVDGSTQSTYRVIDDPVVGSSGIEAAVIKPRARDVFKSIYIPNQEIILTKGNITDLAEGVTLVDEDDNISSFASDGMEFELPEPNRSRIYHEFNVPEMILLEMPSSGKKPVETEQPKGKNEPTQKPTPTPHPEDREAEGTSNSESLSIVVKLKGGKIRVYEPKLICEADWDGEFNLGFESMTVESNLVVESKIKFEKEMCVRIYGYGVDYDSGSEILGRRIAAHLGVGIYAVIGVNGEITITAKIESVGDIRGGVMGNFWGVLLGVPSALPYAWYDKKDFEAAILLNGKINAWAYVGPQLTLDVLDFNLLTAQVWLGLEAEAIIEGEASEENGLSIQLDLSADFVALFRAWLFNNPIEKYILKFRIFEKTFQYKKGAMVGGDSVKDKIITPVIQVDGCCAHRDTLWGHVWYEDKLAGVTNVANIPIHIIHKRNGVTTDIQINTDSNGYFEYKFRGTDRLLPTDTISITIDHVVEDGDQTITYRASTLEPIYPSIPFGLFVIEADAFNDIVSGTVSPCKTPLPGYPEEENYEGYININIFDENGDILERKRVYASDGAFEAEFSDSELLSGGHKVMASFGFETGLVESSFVDVNLDNINLIVDCLVDGVDASLIDELQKGRIGQFGIIAKSIIAEGTVTNMRDGRPFEGDVYMSLDYPFGGGSWEDHIPLDLNYDNIESYLENKSMFDNIALLAIPKKDFDDEIDFELDDDYFDEDDFIDDDHFEDIMDSMLLPVSSFSREIDPEDLGELGSFISAITFEIEYEGLIKRVVFNFVYDDQDIVAGQTNQADRKMTETIDSIVNWPDIMISMGQSQMRVNGRIRSIDGRGNTSIMMVDNEVFVPIEAVVKALGGSVSYDAKQKLTVKLSNKSIVCYNGETNIMANGKKAKMGAAPFMSDNGTMMFPESFLSEALDLTTEWSPDTNTLSVWSANETVK